MAAPPAYLDECVDYSRAEAVRERGFDVVAAADIGNLRLEDNAQLAHAAKQQMGSFG